MIDVGTQRGRAPSSPSRAQTSLRAPAAATLSRERACALRSLTTTLQNTQTFPSPKCPSILPGCPLTLINSDSRTPPTKKKITWRSVSALPSYLTRALTFSLYLSADQPHSPLPPPPSCLRPRCFTCQRVTLRRLLLCFYRLAVAFFQRPN